MHDGLQRLWSAKPPWKLSITVACFVVLVTEQMMTQQETEASRIQEVEVFLKRQPSPDRWLWDPQTGVSADEVRCRRGS